MRNFENNSSIFGIGSICQGIQLIVRGNTLRTLRAHLVHALRWCAMRPLADTRGQWPLDWQALLAAKPLAKCYAMAKRPERQVRVTCRRSVG